MGYIIYLSDIPMGYIMDEEVSEWKAYLWIYAWIFGAGM